MQNIKKLFGRKLLLLLITFVFFAFIMSGCGNNKLTSVQKQWLSYIEKYANDYELEKIQEIEEKGDIDYFLDEVNKEFTLYDKGHDYDSDRVYIEEMGISSEDKIKLLKEKAYDHIKNTAESGDVSEVDFDALTKKYLYEKADEIGVSEKADKDIGFRSLYTYLNLYDIYCLSDDLNDKKPLLSENELDELTISKAISD